MVKRNLIKIFIDEIYSRAPLRNYPTKKIVYSHIDEIWSSDLADMIDYKTSKNKGFRYIFVIKDNFSKYLLAIPLKNKYSQTITNEFSNILLTSKRKLLKIESDRGTEFYNSIFQNFLRSKIIKHYSRFTDKGPSIAERVIKTLRNLLKKPVIEKRNADWLSELPSVIKQYKNNIRTSTKMTPNQASKKSNEAEVYSNLKDNREVRKSKYKLGQLVRTADIKRVFSKGDSTNWSYKFYTTTEAIHDTIPSYRIDYLPERYNQNLLLPTKLSRTKQSSYERTKIFSIKIILINGTNRKRNYTKTWKTLWVL